MSAVGLEMGVSVLLGYGAGWWVDGKLGTEPWGGIVGICLGFAAGVRSMWRLAKQIEYEASLETEDQAQPTGDWPEDSPPEGSKSEDDWPEERAWPEGEWPEDQGSSNDEDAV